MDRVVCVNPLDGSNSRRRAGRVRRLVDLHAMLQLPARFILELVSSDLSDNMTTC